MWKRSEASREAVKVWPDQGHSYLGQLVQAVLGTNGLPLATAAPWISVPSSGVDRSECTLLGMGKVTGGLFRQQAKAFKR